VIIVLYKPEIPQNTGNIVRTCSVTGTDLVLVRPLGFETTDRYLKRAGLDYWNEVNIKYIDDLPSYLEKQNKPFYFFSSKATKYYTDISYTEDTILIFGSESSGLDPSFYKTYESQLAKIPMINSARCLNLSNAVSIVLYEGLRQTGFCMKTQTP